MTLEAFKHIASGRAKRDWRRAQLGSLCKTTSGGTPSRKRAEFFSGSIPWVKSGELTDGPVSEVEEFITGQAISNSSAKVFPPGTLLIALYGATVGKLGILSIAAATNQAVCAIFPEPDLDTKFLFWYLRHRRSDLVAQAVGGAQPNISQSILRTLDVPVPPLNEQRRIVAEIEKQFSRLDEAVANLKRVKVNLKRYKAAVLKAAVEGRLVPTEAELASREGRSYESGAELLQRILEARRRGWSGKGKYREPSKAETGQLPQLPEGWVWATVDSLATKVSDGVHKKPNYVAAGIPFVTVRNLTACRGIDFENLSYVSEEDHQEFCKRTHPERGDILVTKDGTLGVVRLVETDKPFSVFVSVALVKPALCNIGCYLATAFESPVVQQQMVPKGSGLQHIHLEDLRLDCVPLPPLAEQQRIFSEVERRLSLVRGVEADVEANLKRTQALRQTVLSKAFAA